VQQGVENFFATQRILVDLAMSQNARAMNFLRERLQDPAFRPASILTEVASEGMSNFIEGQKLLLNLAQQEYEIVTKGVKVRVGGYKTAGALWLQLRSVPDYTTLYRFLRRLDEAAITRALNEGRDSELVGQGSRAESGYSGVGIRRRVAKVGHKWANFGLCWCGWQTVGSAPDDKSFYAVANRRDGCIMVPFFEIKKEIPAK